MRHDGYVVVLTEDGRRLAGEAKAKAGQMVPALDKGRDRALGDSASLNDDADAPAQSIDIIEQMRAHQDTDAAARQPEQNVVDFSTPAGIEAIRRFVENEQPRIRDERT